MPPKETKKKDFIKSKKRNDSFLVYISKSTVNKTILVPSLIIDSPSTIFAISGLFEDVFKTETTDTGSVGVKIAANNKELNIEILTDYKLKKYMIIPKKKIV